MPRKNHDFVKLKPPNVPTSYTPAQLKELYACAKDPLYFMQRYLYVQHPTRGKIQFEAYEFQKELITNYWSYRNVIAMIPRQSGKCLHSDINISIYNKKTEKQYKIPIGLYYEWAAAIRDGKTPPDISKYECT